MAAISNCGACSGLLASRKPYDGRVSISQVASAAEAMNNDIPRTPSGKPDFNGIWQALMNANDNLELAAPKAANHLVPGDFVPVPGPEVVALELLEQFRQVLAWLRG